MTSNGFNLAGYVLEAGAPEKMALQVLGASQDNLTYADLRKAVLGTATGLRQLGLAPGARVLLRLGNTPDFPIAYLGALAAGLVPVPSSAALTEPEVARMIADLSPHLILRDPEVACTAHPGVLDLNTLRDMRGLPAADIHLGDPERPGYIIYTSGTSGQPRAVVHAHRAILARRLMFDGWYGLRASDRVLHAGAFNWTYTLGTGLMDPWTIGATALIPQSGTPAMELPQMLVEHRATIFAAAPGVYRQALRGSVPPLPDLRHGLSAGEKMPISTHETWTKATGTRVHEAFGMSECSTFISSSPARPASPAALGWPQPQRRVAILGESGEAPANTPGTIAVHRSDPGLMLGYLNQPEDTQARYDGDWFLTGDEGVADETGQITYLGRKDDMLNAGGFRVSPLEIEQVLNTHPHVTAAAAVELPLMSGARIIGAFYVSPAPVDEGELLAYVNVRLARYKQPRLFQHVAELPTGANGKLQRRRLRESWTSDGNG